jgi:aspartyl/asparaginyl beta-hydroxylase (cupin superfamily)
LKAGFTIEPHVDYDPSYISRYHIPIITNSDVTMYIQRGDNVAQYSMSADGRIYFFNSGLKHWVKNNSQFDRLHLIIDVHGQHDLENLEEIIF